MEDVMECGGIKLGGTLEAKRCSAFNVTLTWIPGLLPSGARIVMARRAALRKFPTFERPPAKLLPFAKI